MAVNVMLYHTGKDKMYNTWHKNEQGCFLYIHSGKGIIAFSNKIYSIERGSLLYIPYNRYHYTLPEKPNEYTRSKIFISNKQVAALASEMVFHATYPVCSMIPPSEQSEIELIYSQLKNTSLKGEHFDMLANGCLMQLSAYLDAYKISAPDFLNGYIEDSLHYINQNISSRLTVEEIAKSVNLSKYYYCHIFKDAIGTSVMDYVINTRLTFAKELLISTQKSVSAISEACGFETLSCFCHQFKHYTGMSALNYRKNIQKSKKEIE